MGTKKFGELKPIEVEVVNIRSETRMLRCEHITQDMLTAVVKAGQDDSGVVNAVYDQIAIYFGGSASDYADLDGRTVMAVIRYVSDQLKNPS